MKTGSRAMSCALLIAGGWLILFAIMLRVAAACPPSCVICTKDVTLCHQLTYIVAAPVTTRVLIITDGSLSSVERANMSLLLNLALLSLSRNSIRDVQEDALHGLTKLRTLLLEHNHISSSSLADHTFSKLRSLQVLVLSNNALRSLRGAWFRRTSGLTRLQLDGNLITNLTDSSFGGTNLHSLRHLDLSNNFISYIEKDAFRPLPRLQEVDLSRNRLAHMPDVFTPLKQLILLSLDKNQWSCTCDLHPLARFLRNYIKSSAHTLRNAKDLNCQPSLAAVASAKSVLRLSETNCDSKPPNHTMNLKDRRLFLPGQDVALLTLFGFAGAVGFTCLGLVVFNWKLQQGKANEHTSENLCCRTFDESLCAHEARNYHAKGYCNCHLTQENEIKVMSIVGSRKEMPLLQENSHQATLASESTALDRSFRNLKVKDHGADSTFFCMESRLLQTGCLDPPGKAAAFNDAGLVTRYCPKRVEKLRNPEPGEVQCQTLTQHVTRTIDISGDTFRRRYSTSASALARESLEKHLTNESWQPPIEKEDSGLQPHRQRHFITSSSSKPTVPEEQYVQKILPQHRSKYDEPRGLLKWNKPRYLQMNNSLICKYVSCDQFQDYKKEKKSNSTKHSKSEKEQIEINSAIEKFLLNEDNKDLSRLSTKFKKAYSPKRVSHHDCDLVGKKRLVKSAKISTHWKQQESQSNQLTTLDLKKSSNPGVKSNGGRWFTESQIMKNKRINQSDLKGKVKGRNLRIQLNLHPFRKVRVHPEKSSPELLGKWKQAALLPKLLPKTSAKKVKINPVSSADFLQQSGSNNCVDLTSKRLTLEHAPKQTPYYKRNTKNTRLSVNLSTGNQSSVNGNYYSTGQVPNGNLSTVPLLTLGDTQHGLSLSQFSTEQMEGVTQFQMEVPSHSPDTSENVGNNELPFRHPRKVTDQGAREPAEHLEQNESKTSELNKLSLSPRNQVQFLGVYEIDIYNRECTLEQNQALQHEEQNSSHEQRENEEKMLMAKSKMSHQTVGNCIMDKKGNEIGKSLLNTETSDSSLIPWTPSKSNLPFMMTHSTPHQNRTERPSTSLSSQAIWHLTNSSKKGTDGTNVLPRDHSTQALEIKIVEQEGERILAESKTNSSLLTWTTQMTSKGITNRKQQTWENENSEEHVAHDSSSVEETITVKDLSITSSHETKDRIPHSEADLQINSPMHDLREIQNIQPDKDSSAHREGETAVETHAVPPLSTELKDIRFEAENEVPLIPSRINEAENSVPKPVPHPPSAEYANTSPLEAEHSEQNN